MYRVPIRGKIRPKLSSVPRRNTEASIYLNIYKMTVEKERLQRELTNIESRRTQIKDRLGLLKQQTAIELKKVERSANIRADSPTASPEQKEEFKNFQTITLEY